MGGTSEAGVRRMGPWTRSLVTVQIERVANHELAARATVTRTSQYPGTEKSQPPHGAVLLGSTSLPNSNATELVDWLGSLKIQPDSLVHLRIGADASERGRIFALPWHQAIQHSVVSFRRGKPPKRKRLSLPLVFSTTQSHAFLAQRIDALVNTTRASTLGQQGHIVLGLEGNKLIKAIGPRTRLLVIEGNQLQSAPEGPFNVIQIAGPSDQRIEFVRYLFRAILHDAPLDAALHAAMLKTNFNMQAVRFDLFDHDEHCLRLREALHEAVIDIRRAKSHLPKDGSKPTRAGDLDDAADALTTHAKTVSFDHELVGADSTLHELGKASVAIDVADAANAYAGEIELDRSAQLWIEDKASRVIAPDKPLEIATPYFLNFQIATEIRSHATTAVLPNERLKILFEKAPKLDLDVVLYADTKKVRIDCDRFTLTLKRWGATEIRRTAFEPLEAGVHQVRACVFFRGNLLQSIALRLGILEPGDPACVDYSGVDTFTGLLDLPGVDSIWINDTDDKHWIGVYALSSALGELVDFKLATPTTSTVKDSVPAVRSALSYLEGVGGSGAHYLFAAANPVSDVLSRQQEKRFVDLACAGRRMFTRVMQQPNTADQSYIEALATRLKAPDRIVSIARLDDESSVPWALMYDHRIDPSDPTLELCTRFKKDRPGGSKFAESPQECSSQVDCPLKVLETARKTVCPFGFWGFRHQIELRLGNKCGSANPIDRTRIVANERPRAAAAMFNFPESVDHLQSLGAVLETGAALDDRTAVLAALREGTRSLYYFFCHADQSRSVQLRIAANQLIEPASIAERYEAAEDGWAVAEWDARRPLVFLNACQSVALDAQLISPFLDKFFGLGASGLVGTEVFVFSELAAEIGTKLLTRMISDRETLGAALLGVRRKLLGAGNPMGLAYSVYGSAALHFHVNGCKCGVA